MAGLRRGAALGSIPRVGVGSLLAAMLAVPACGGGDGETGPTTTTTVVTTTTAGPTTTAPGTPVDVVSLGPGDCFEERVVPGQGETTVSQVVSVDCSLPHDNEIYLAAEMPDAIGAAWPGQDAVRSFADQACLDGFEPFVGLQYELSELELGYLTPTEETWFIPDRRVLCFVFHREGTKLEGSARGSAE